MATDDIDPPAAFALLADPNRFELIEALATAEAETLPFNELYERSNFEDSGQFNYHLDKLVGSFLRKTEEGYTLRHAARIVYRLAVGGLLADHRETAVADLEAPCPRCETRALAAAYEGDRFWVRCSECGRRAAVGPFPPRALDAHGPDRAPAAFDRYTMGTVVRAVENVCPWCGSELSASLTAADDEWPAVDWVIARRCGHCRGWIHTRVYDLLRLHPAVIAHYHRRGMDVLGRPFWEIEAVMAPETDLAVDTEEWAATATVDGLRLGLAEDLRVSTVTVL